MTEPVAALWIRVGQQLTALPATGWALAVGVLATITASLWWKPTHLSSRWSSARWFVGGVVVCLAVAHAWSLRWIADDAFISFRYARNLVEGHGLVFNPGERVEGYTNFLWTVLLAGAYAIGIPFGLSAIAFGLLSVVAVLWLTTRLSQLLSPYHHRPLIPVAALLLASNYVFATFGTSGMETLFATALVLLSLERAIQKSYFQAGTAGVCAMMAHPDHAIFFFALAVAIGLGRPSRTTIVRFALPFVLFFLPYFLVRWRYYDSLLPNTFYAKSADESYFTQGQVYVLISAVSAGIIGWLPLALTGLHTQRSRLFGRFLFIALPPYTLYLLKIGGDFMLGRLLVPWLPLFAISADFAARYLFAKQRRLCATIGLTLAATSALPLRILHPAEKFFHIADERTFYPVETIHPLRIDSPYSTWADQLISTFGEGSHGPLTAIGSIGIVAFQTRYPMLDVFGLTDIEIARQPIVQRGRPGHEKLASPSLLLDRGVLLTDRNVFPPEYASWTEVYPGFIPLHSLAYRTDLVTAIRKTTNSSFTDVPSRIERYEPPADDPYRVACDLWFFETYYFAHQSPQARRQFIHRLLKNGKLSPNTAAFFELSDHDEPRGWSRSLTIDFAQVDKRSWLRSGTAFDAFPTDGPILGQTRVSGHSGPLVNSFTSAQGDGALGMLQSPSFRLDGEVITLRVGGGKDATRLRAVLVVDGDEVMTATGCDSEILGRRVWDIAKFRGKSARLVVEDRSADGWGHILLDEFALWRSGS